MADVYVPRFTKECSQCGSLLKFSYNYCPQCGAELHEESRNYVGRVGHNGIFQKRPQVFTNSGAIKKGAQCNDVYSNSKKPLE